MFARQTLRSNHPTSEPEHIHESALVFLQRAPFQMFQTNRLVEARCPWGFKTAKQT